MTEAITGAVAAIVLITVVTVVAAIASATKARRTPGSHRDDSHRVVQAVELGHVEPVTGDDGKVRYRITDAGKAALEARIGRRR